MRMTIHLVSRREFWRYAMGVRQARRAWACGRRAWPPPSRSWSSAAERLREALADGPRTVKELGELGAGFVGNLGLWVDLVRVPPSGTWERRRADRLGARRGRGSGRATPPRRRASGTSSAPTCGRSGRPPGRTSPRGPGSRASDAKRGRRGARRSSTFRDEAGRRAGRPRRRAAAGPGRAGAGPLPAPLGRQPARPRPPDGHPARAVPAAGLQHEEPVLGRDVPGRWVAWRAPGRSGTAASCSTRTEELGSRDRRAVEREREALEAFVA